MNKTTGKKQSLVYFTIFVLLFAMVILPILAIFKEAVIIDGNFNFTKAIETIANKNNLTTIKNSLLLGFLVVLVSTIISTPLSFLLARTKFARWKWLDIVLMIPFMTPPYISSMGWILFMQKEVYFNNYSPGLDLFQKNFSPSQV